MVRPFAFNSPPDSGGAALGVVRLFAFNSPPNLGGAALEVVRLFVVCISG